MASTQNALLAPSLLGYAFNGVKLTSGSVAITQANPKDPELGKSIDKKLAQRGDNWLRPTQKSARLSVA